ncbi:MAG: hypothetical protein KY437_09740, partial [Actinobacteria bacterium]|nr:hypothetical protein [Actinomycetota bacterium]
LTGLGYDARVKWPNDVLLADSHGDPEEERKVAGVLVERIDSGTGPAAVLGVGLIVTTTADELPVPTATSLQLARPDVVPDRDEVLVAVVTALRERYDAWLAGGDTAAASGEYRAARSEAGVVEAAFWHGVMLAEQGDVDGAREVLRDAFDDHDGWELLLSRLPAADLLPEDVVVRILGGA